MRLTPAVPERALVLHGDEDVLLVGDLHVGLEVELRQEGLRLPSQTERMRERLARLLDENGCHRLAILGDLKHTITHASGVESAALVRLFEGLDVPVDLVPGNHDADLPELPPHVTKHPATGMRLGDVGISHGHTWPSADVLAASVVVTCHNHPHVSLVDELGHRHKEPCWVRGPFSRAARERFPDLPRGAKFVVMPNFNDLLGGVAFNALEKEEYLGPLLRNGVFDVEKAKIHTVDGIDLGTVASLRRYAATGQGRRRLRAGGRRGR
ncbi:MAG TPA: metallophosphoesterase [Candidatus Thermoplasmatota archaeon]|nr:metallophosphoesterase [Candidatus Thermoplasmatota archaeon]